MSEENIKFNKDELEAPGWMEEKFFHKIIQHLKENASKLKILDYKMTPATAVGDHFASIMFRANVRYSANDKEKEISLIIKTMPEVDGIKKDMLKDSKIFENEIRMYRDVIPTFEKILKDAGDNTRLGAKMLYYTLEPQKVIVFEDLAKEGFRTIGKRMTTFDEAKMALDKLAKWHAVSYKYNLDNSDNLTSFIDGVYNLPNVETNEFFTSGMSSLIKVIETLPELHQYLPKLKKVEHKLFSKLRETYFTPTNLNVLNHGDFHAKNMMFKFDSNGNATEVMLVDFQMCVWTSMAIDILYGIHMLIDHDTRKHHRDELIYYFFCKFIDTLKLIDYRGKLPTFSDLKIDMIKLNYLELFLISTFSPFMHGIQSNLEIDPEKVMECPEEIVKFYHLPSYIEEIKYMLPIFNNGGYLDGYDSE